VNVSVKYLRPKSVGDVVASLNTRPPPVVLTRETFNTWEVSVTSVSVPNVSASELELDAVAPLQSRLMLEMLLPMP
jgi:hypothetical protein